MKKAVILLMIAALACSLCACGSEFETTVGDSGAGQNPSVQQSADNPGASSPKGALRLLCSPYGESACNTENGYYYLTGNAAALRDGNYGTHLMYMDFAAGREIYLCSTAGCKHDSLDCPAVFLYDDFPSLSTKLFVFGDHLYILSREYDNDGSMSTGMITIGGDGNTVESKPAVLYRANLDGTQRQKVYSFDPGLTLEDLVIGDNQGIYVVTKKLSADKTGNQTYTTSSERKLMFLDLESFACKEICPMYFDDHISWQIIGCYQNHFVLSGMDFGKELSRDEQWNDDVYRDLYQNSSEVYALLDLNSGKLKEICRQPNQYESSVKVLGDNLYLSSSENQKIEAVNLGTGEKKTLCTLPQNCMMDVLGDMLCCRTWDLSKDQTFYFVNTKTGAVTHTPLVNRCNGWAIEFRGETASDILFVYDYDATKGNDDSYEIRQYKHALISKDDLFAGRENYRKIEMIGLGQ